MTFIVFPAGDYEIGSPDDEPRRDESEARHRVTITRPFAILDREPTLEELSAFHEYYPIYMGRMQYEPNHSAMAVDWYHAARFCRWLTASAGWSEDDQPYSDPDTLDEKEFPRDPTARTSIAITNWPLRLDRAGFRSPNEAEWEIACRGGAATRYSFGCDPTLLEHYARFQDNSRGKINLPRLARPNLRGIFDLHVNVYEWCHGWYGPYSQDGSINPIGSDVIVQGRVYRGGCYNTQRNFCRSSHRSGSDPSAVIRDLSFRVVLNPISDPTKSARQANR